MTSSTRSEKVIKQEEEEQQEGDQSGVAAEALSPRPQTSLLSLPNDLLLQIYEELYEDQHGDKNISPPVSEILVNKRLFNLARPIWFSRLSIRKHQLDRRLVGLLNDSVRLAALRSLDLHFHESHAHLIRMTLSRLTFLVRLCIRNPGSPSPLVKQTVLRGVQEGGSVKDVEFHLGRGSVSLMQAFGREFRRGLPGQLRSLKISTTDCKLQNVGDEDAQGGLSLLNVPLEPYATQFWSCRSFEYEFDHGSNPRAQEFLQGLEESARNPNSGPGTSSSLNRFALRIPVTTHAERHDQTYFTDNNLARLFRLLSLTQIERLELNTLDWIPSLEIEDRLLSVKLLKLSGTSSFSEAPNFRKLAHLISVLPSLTQLHLCGSNFFGANLKADKISKYDDFILAMISPPLAALLFALRTTEVEIFTYRGGGEKREMRWTRSSTQEDFVRDCWTL
ncbi:hypothetical protein JCM3765_000043 [Sporobolomyces pararoseus]